MELATLFKTNLIWDSHKEDFRFTEITAMFGGGCCTPEFILP
jgi:hypothetical protein